MPTLKQIAPLVPVTDVLKSADFFESTLGFSAIFKAEHFAHLVRDNAHIKLQRAGDHVGQQACYIDVDGVDALYQELKPKLEQLPDNRVRAPFNQDYGMREFHVIDLDHLLIFFGEPVKD